MRGRRTGINSNICSRRQSLACSNYFNSFLQKVRHLSIKFLTYMIWRVWTRSLTIQVVVGSISLADMKPLLGPEQRSDESSLTVLVAYGLPLSPEIILFCINLKEWLYNAYIWSGLFVKPIYNVDNNQNKDVILHHGSSLRVNSSAG